MGVGGRGLPGTSRLDKSLGAWPRSADVAGSGLGPLVLPGLAELTSLATLTTALTPLVSLAPPSALTSGISIYPARVRPPPSPPRFSLKERSVDVGARAERVEGSSPGEGKDNCLLLSRSDGCISVTFSSPPSPRHRSPRCHSALP